MLVRENRDPLFRGLHPGPATTVAQAWASTLNIRAQTGHASDAMLSRHIRDGEIFTGNTAGTVQ